MRVKKIFSGCLVTVPLSPPLNVVRSKAVETRILRLSHQLKSTPHADADLADVLELANVGKASGSISRLAYLADNSNAPH